MERLADWVTAVSLSVAPLLARFGSVTPAGTPAFAVLATVPVALKVALPPTARLTVVLMLPLLPPEPQDEPAVAPQVQLTPVRVSGKLSVTGTLEAALGPALETTMV